MTKKLRNYVKLSYVRLRNYVKKLCQKVVV